MVSAEFVFAAKPSLEARYVNFNSVEAYEKEVNRLVSCAHHLCVIYDMYAEPILINTYKLAYTRILSKTKEG